MSAPSKFMNHEIGILLSESPEAPGLWMELLTGFMQRF